jgi:hypothetical protein
MIWRISKQDEKRKYSLKDRPHLYKYGKKTKVYVLSKYLEVIISEKIFQPENTTGITSRRTRSETNNVT